MSFCLPASGSPFPCSAGAFCAAGTAVQQQCPAGSYCPLAASAPKLCLAVGGALECPVAAWTQAALRPRPAAACASTSQLEPANRAGTARHAEGSCGGWTPREATVLAVPWRLLSWRFQTMLMQADCRAALGRPAGCVAGLGDLSIVCCVLPSVEIVLQIRTESDCPGRRTQGLELLPICFEASWIHFQWTFNGH